jgi:phosphoribosylanthranilate isomerase
VTAARAGEIAALLPAGLQRVGVFVDADPGEIAAVQSHVALDVVQLHGAEPPDRWPGAGASVFKMTAAVTDEDVKRAIGWPAHVVPLVDAADAARRGGTGQLADWSRAARLAAARPIVLAGGLTPENVGAAIRQVRPWAVDVSSGVEDRPGIKNAARMAAFLAAVAAADGAPR